MQIKVTDTPDAFDLPEWRDLCARVPHRHVFSLPEWNRVWWEEFGGSKQLQVLTIIDEDPVAVIPLMFDDTSDGRRIRFLGGDDLTDYLGPIIPEASTVYGVADALTHWLIEDAPEWDLFDAKCMPVPFGFADRLAETADRHHLRFEVDEHELTAVLPITGTFEDYLASLGQKHRHELRRKIRRFDSQVSASRVRTATDATIAGDVLTFVDMHRGSEGLKGKFFMPERATFFARVAQVFQPMGLLRLDFLEVEDRPMAATFSFEYANRFYLYNSAYEPEARPLSPGLILLAKLIERSCESGVEAFDFLRGRERYKFDLGAQALPLHSVLIHRS